MEAAHPRGAPPLPLKIHIFTGPLDLLLHLARASRLDLSEVPLAQITG